MDTSCGRLGRGPDGGFEKLALPFRVLFVCTNHCRVDRLPAEYDGILTLPYLLKSDLHVRQDDLVRSFPDSHGLAKVRGLNDRANEVASGDARLLFELLSLGKGTLDVQIRDLGQQGGQELGVTRANGAYELKI